MNELSMKSDVLVSLDNCGCCAGVEAITPLDISNRPGLDVLRYRIGTHSAFFQSMIARLTSLCDGTPKECQTGKGQHPLRDKLTTRNQDDPAIALLDAWALVADVLTFYQEKLANEGFLRTAQDRRSLYELGRLVGYQPRPGVAAQVHLAFEVEAPPTVTTAVGLANPGTMPRNVDTTILIPKGTRVKSTPAPGTDEQPQVFETSADFRAQPGWNEIPLITARPYSLTAGRLFQLAEFRFQGIGLRIQPNDLIVFAVGGKGHKARRVIQVREDNEQRVTIVQFVRDLMTEEEYIASLRQAAERYLRELPLRHCSLAYIESIREQVSKRLSAIETSQHPTEKQTLLRLDHQVFFELQKKFDSTTITDTLREDAHKVYEAVEKDIRSRALQKEHDRQENETVWITEHSTREALGELLASLESFGDVQNIQGNDLHIAHLNGILAWRTLFPVRADAEIVSCTMQNPRHKDNPQEGVILGDCIQFGDHSNSGARFEATLSIVASPQAGAMSSSKAKIDTEDEIVVAGTLEEIQTKIQTVKVTADNPGRFRVGISLTREGRDHAIGYGEVECLLGDPAVDLEFASDAPHLHPIVNVVNSFAEAEEIGKQPSLQGDNMTGDFYLRCERVAGDAGRYFNVETNPTGPFTFDQLPQALANLSARILQASPVDYQGGTNALKKFLVAPWMFFKRLAGIPSANLAYDPPSTAVLIVRISVVKKLASGEFVDLASIVRQVPLRVWPDSVPAPPLDLIAAEAVDLTGGSLEAFRRAIKDYRDRLKIIVTPVSVPKYHTYEEAFIKSKETSSNYSAALFDASANRDVWNGQAEKLIEHLKLNDDLETEVLQAIEAWLEISSEDELSQRVPHPNKLSDRYCIYFDRKEPDTNDVVGFLNRIKSTLGSTNSRIDNLRSADSLLSDLEVLANTLYSSQDLLESEILRREMVVPAFRARLQVLKWFEQALEPHLPSDGSGDPSLKALSAQLNVHKNRTSDALRVALAAEPLKTDPATDPDSHYLVLELAGSPVRYALIPSLGAVVDLGSGGDQLPALSGIEIFFYRTGSNEPGLYKKEMGQWVKKQILELVRNISLTFYDIRNFPLEILDCLRIVKFARDVRARLDDRLQGFPVRTQEDWWDEFRLDPAASVAPISASTPELLNLQEMLAGQLLRLGVMANQLLIDGNRPTNLQQALSAFRRFIQGGGGIGSRQEDLKKALDEFYDLIPQVLAALNFGEQTALLEVLRQYRSLPEDMKPSVWVLRTKAKIFGWNAPAAVPRAVFDEHRADELATLLQVITGIPASVFEPHIRQEFLRNHRVAQEEARAHIYLDGAFERILPGTPVFIETASETEQSQTGSPSGQRLATGEPTAEVFVIPPPHLVVASQTRPRSAYGLSNETTAVQLDRKWWDADLNQFSVIRTTRVHCEAEELKPDLEPVEPVLLEVYELDLDGLYSGLSPGKKLILSGVPENFGPDSKVRFSELIEIHEVRVRLSSAGYGAKYHTRLTLRNPLNKSYIRSSVRINANVVEATHGETQSEILGGGRGTEPLARYQLKSSPLTHVPAPTETGVKPELSLTVNATEWTLQKSLDESKPADRHFTMRIGSGGETHILFGDGEQGARLPTGHSNIKVQYRSGIGSSGNVPANRIDQLVGAVLGLKGGINPLPASGGADPDPDAVLRERIPLGLSALDRIVSIGDFQDFAEQFAGVAKAHTEARPDRILVTIAGHSPEALRPDDLIVQSLIGAFRQFSNDMTRVEVLPHTPVLIGLHARVAIRPKVRWDDVERRLRSLLLTHFSFEKARFLARVEPAQIIEVLHQDPDVVYIDLEGLNPIREQAVTSSIKARDDKARDDKARDDKARDDKARDDKELVKDKVEVVEAFGPKRPDPLGEPVWTGAELCFFSNAVRDTIRLSQIEERIP